MSSDISHCRKHENNLFIYQASIHIEKSGYVQGVIKAKDSFLPCKASAFF
jgi:hypothetical protein